MPIIIYRSLSNNIYIFLFSFFIFKKYKIFIQKFKKSAILIPSKIISSFVSKGFDMNENLKLFYLYFKL